MKGSVYFILIDTCIIICSKYLGELYYFKASECMHSSLHLQVAVYIGVVNDCPLGAFLHIYLRLSINTTKQFQPLVWISFTRSYTVEVLNRKQLPFLLGRQPILGSHLIIWCQKPGNSALFSEKGKFLPGQNIPAVLVEEIQCVNTHLHAWMVLWWFWRFLM